MTLLISKVQHRNCEKGEFHDVENRTLEETLSLLLDFPWESERHLADVELTCPSVTVEHPAGTFLKVGPYFSGKFSLYYLDCNGQVCFKVASTLVEASDCIRSFYKQEGILPGFSKYGFVWKPSAHFQTNPFIYERPGTSTNRFFKDARLTLFICLFFCLLMFFKPMPPSVSIFLVVMCVLIALAYSPLIYLYFNYRKFEEGRWLQLSRGSSSFILGLGKKMKMYRKSEIESITVEGRRNRRSPSSVCKIYTIKFQNGDQIHIISLLIPEDDFRNKFPDYIIQTVGKFFPAV